MQYLEDELPAGHSTDTFRTYFGKDSLCEYGFTGQVGYFLVPQRWEVVVALRRS